MNKRKIDLAGLCKLFFLEVKLFVKNALQTLWHGAGCGKVINLNWFN